MVWKHRQLRTRACSTITKMVEKTVLATDNKGVQTVAEIVVKVVRPHIYEDIQDENCERHIFVISDKRPN